jgi:septal ring factor EnvC (AmiA/AmiB activator)
MTQDRPDRLDRIEATLERVSQQLDNQVVVNAELRQSTAELTQSVSELRVSANALVETANLHQQGLELLAREMREQRTSINQLQEFERTTSAALDRISAVLDYLVRQDNHGS